MRNTTKIWGVLVIGLIFLGLGGYRLEASYILIGLGMGQIFNLIEKKEVKHE